MGYTPNQKGYKLLNLKTKSFFVSRDVVFEEHVFPFAASAAESKHEPSNSGSPLEHNEFSSPVFDDEEPLLHNSPSLHDEEDHVPSTNSE